MSSKMQCLRKSKVEVTPLIGDRKSRRLENSKKRSIHISTVADFNSETLSSSSPVKPGSKSEKKMKRKRIRATEDFNQLNNSTSQDSDVSVKSELRKTRKAKDIYTLPKIAYLLEDHFGNKENPSPAPDLNCNSSRKKSRKPRKNYALERVETPDYVSHKANRITANRRTRRLKTEYMNSSPISFTLDKDVTKKDVNSSNRRKDIEVQSLGKYQNNNFMVPDRKRDSEVEINIKHKKKQKGDGRSNINTEKASCYIEKIKQMLLNDYNISNKGNETTKSLNTKKIAESRKSADLSIQQKIKSNSRLSKSLDNDFTMLNSGDNEKVISDNSSFTSKLNGHDVREKSRDSSVSFAQCSEGVYSTINEHVGPVLMVEDYSLKPNENMFYTSDTDDDVFDRGENNLNQVSKKSLSCFSPKAKLQENIKERRKTLDVNYSYKNLTVEKTPKRKSLMHLTQNKHARNIGSFEHNMGCKRDATFHVDTSKVLNYPIIENAIIIKGTPSENEYLFENSTNKNITVNETFEVNSPISGNLSKRKSKRSTINLPSPIYGTSSGINTAVKCDIHSPTEVNLLNNKDTFELSKNSPLNSTFTFDLVAPAVIKVRNSAGVILIESSPSGRNMHDSDLNQLSRHSSYIKNDSLRYDKKLQNVSTEVNSNNIFNSTEANTKAENSPNRDRSYQKVQTPMTTRLTRTATFTKDDCDNINEKTVQFDSPAVVEISGMKNIDTSKVTKRRQWDKSRISLSFMDASLDIGNISAPWTEDVFDQTLDKLNDSKKVIVGKCSTIKPKDNNTILSGIDTPLLTHENKVLKEKRNVTFDESKNLSKVISKPIVKSAKRKMPNFALIHQRAYEKMENLKEMSERKAARAKLLLSGCNPDIASAKSKKCLQFSLGSSQGVSVKETVKFNESEKEETKASNISITKVNSITPSRSNPKVANKENKATPMEKKRELLKKKSRIPTLKVPNTLDAEKKGFTRYGFKVGNRDVKATTKEEQVKAVATKTKVIKNTVEERRNAVQGVRTNRRFELLMALRNK